MDATVQNLPPVATWCAGFAHLLLSRDILLSTLLSYTLSQCLSLDLRDHVSGGTRFESRLGVRLFLMRGILCFIESPRWHEPPYYLLNVILDQFQMERLFMLSEFGCNLNGARYKLMYCIEDSTKSRTVSLGSYSFTSPPVAATSCIFFLLFEA